MFLAALAVNLAAPTGAFVIKSNLIKKQMKRYALSKTDNADLERIAVPKEALYKRWRDFRTVHEREFRFDGRLYDIVRTDTTRDSIIFHAINDRDEEELIKRFALRDDKTDPARPDKNAAMNGIKLFGFDWTPSNESDDSPPIWIKTSYSASKDDLIDFIATIIDPPPKRS